MGGGKYQRLEGYPIPAIKGGFYLNAIFPPLDMALMEISRSRFKFQWAPEKLYHHPVNLCCGVFCEFLGDFWVYLGGDDFSRRIGKIKRNERLSEVLKLEFVVNN